MPPQFRFAVKLPRDITHVRKLVDAGGSLEPFLTGVRALGDRLGPLLVQLPPSLQYDAASAGAFLAELRARHDGGVVWEPRHPSWFGEDADALLARFLIARVAADPAPVPRASSPGGWPGLAYRRLHGSPTMYYSAYSDRDLDALAGAMTLDALAGALADPRPRPPESWCIFDNTARGEATGNAMSLVDRLRPD